MLRSPAIARLTLALLAPLALLASCELIAGIDDKELGANGDGGSGGLGGSDTVSGMGGAGGAGGSGGMGGSGDVLPIPLCEGGRQPCEMSCGLESQSAGLANVRHVVTEGSKLYFEGISTTTNRAVIAYLDLKELAPVVTPYLLTEVEDPIEALSVDCDNIYYAQMSAMGHSLYANSTDVPMLGPPSIIDEQSPIINIVANNTVVAWTTGPDSGEGAVRMWTKSEPGMQPPVDIAIQQPEPRGLAIDNTRIYWSNTSISSPLGQSIHYAFIAPSPDGTHATGTVIEGHGPRAIAVDESFIYWIDPVAHVLLRTEKTGGEAVTVALLDPVTSFGDVLVADGDWIYWIQDGTSVRKALKSGAGDTPHIVVPADPIPSVTNMAWLALDQSLAYVVSPSATNSTVLWVGK